MEPLAAAIRSLPPRFDALSRHEDFHLFSLSRLLIEMRSRAYHRPAILRESATAFSSEPRRLGPAFSIFFRPAISRRH
jgi:hypothetical protein